MTITTSLVAFTSCVVLLILANIRCVRKMRNANDLALVDLSTIWKHGIGFLIIGAMLQVAVMATVFDTIQAETATENVVLSIKRSLQFSLGFVCLFVFTLINWFLLKHYRQQLYNERSEL